MHVAKLTGVEQHQLADLAGQPLDEVAADGWCVTLRCRRSVLRVDPFEVHTPDEQHPFATVARVRVSPLSGSIHEGQRLVASALGNVLSVHVLSVLVSFSPPTQGRPIQLPGGTTIPEGVDYHWIYHDPLQKQRRNPHSGTRAIVDLDIGVAIATQTCASLVLYTRGFFVVVSTAGLPDDEDWVRYETFSRSPPARHN